MFCDLGCFIHPSSLMCPAESFSCRPEPLLFSLHKASERCRAYSVGMPHVAGRYGEHLGWHSAWHSEVRKKREKEKENKHFKSKVYDHLIWWRITGTASEESLVYRCRWRPGGRSEPYPDTPCTWLLSCWDPGWIDVGCCGYRGCCDGVAPLHVVRTLNTIKKQTIS